MSGFFFSPALRQLTQGSFESLIARLDESVGEKVKEAFGAEVSHRIIATFPDNAVVVLNNGKVARFSFTERDGNVVIPTYSLLEVEAGADSKTLHVEVKEALRGLMKGDAEAGARLASLVSTVH